MMRVTEFLFGAAILAFCAYAAVSVATSQPQDPMQCPPETKSCKILLLTPDEEQTLIGEQMIFAHAEWANRAGLAGIITAWRNKIAAASQGKPAVKPEPKK